MITELVLLCIISSVCSQSLHHMMTPEDLQKVFSVKTPDEVPDYDVVSISITKPRNRRYTNLYLYTTAFGKDLKLWLTPTDGILAGENLPIWVFKSNPGYPNAPFMEKYDDSLANLLPKLYENERHASTVVVNYQPDKQPRTTGYIGNSYIQPVPSHLMNHAKRHRRSLNISLDHESDDQIYHIIHKIPNHDMKIQSHHIELQPIIQNVTSRSKRSYPEIIYPEILVIVHLSLTKIIGQNQEEMIAYLLAFWNGVDMRYRSLANPRVRLNIAGIVFADDDDVLPYMVVRNGYLINSSNNLQLKGNWLYTLRKYFPLNYDLAVTMFPFTMCDNVICRTFGLAYPGGACSPTHRVAFVRDLGAYDGIQSIAHELGHLFGMIHDGDKNNCKDEDGYIMTRWDKFTPQSFDWSWCSLQQMDTFLKEGGGWCLQNYPNQGNPMPRYLPGGRMNAHQQCKMLSNGYASRIDDSICTQLKCLGYSGFALPEAAEGTPCGTEKLCLHGKCVSRSFIV